MEEAEEVHKTLWSSREVSFGSIGGVTYPHEHAPFDDDDDDDIIELECDDETTPTPNNGRRRRRRRRRSATTTTTTRLPALFPRPKRDLLTTTSFVDVAACGRPVVAARPPERELEDIERARETRMIRHQTWTLVKDANRRKRTEKGKLVEERQREENRYRHATMGIPFACVQTIERLEKEEEARRTRTRREDTVNCLKIFSDGTVLTRDAKGRLVTSHEGKREVVETRSEYQRTFDVQAVEEEEGRGEHKMVAARDFCGVSVSKTHDQRTFQCEFSTAVKNDELPTDMSFTNQSACGRFSDCCLRVATEVGTVKTYRPGESSWVKWDTVSLGLENADGVVRQWHGCYEATHPRTMLYCDSTRIQFVDERRPEVLNTRVGGSSATVFTSRDERIQCASNVLPGTFLFAVGTRKSVKLYDIRKYSPVDHMFSWKHGMHSSPSSVEVRNDFRRAFDTTRINNNNNSNYISSLAVSHKTGDAMAFETKGVNNTCSESFTMSALSAGIRLVPQSMEAPWGGFQFYPG